MPIAPGILFLPHPISNTCIAFKVEARKFFDSGTHVLRKPMDGRQVCFVCSSRVRRDVTRYDAVWHAWRYDWPKSRSWHFIGPAVWQRGFHMPSCERVLLLPNFLPDTGPAESLFRSPNELASSLDMLLC